MSFNPRTPCGVRQSASNTRTARISFQSTHSLRSATLSRPANGWFHIVSIHALLAECDSPGATPKAPKRGFNPRTPCGVRLEFDGTDKMLKGFNPRTPCGVRRRQRPGAFCHGRFQSTHSLRSASGREGVHVFHPWVSIHALLAECDQSSLPRPSPGSPLFQSTHSLRSAT